MKKTGICAALAAAMAMTGAAALAEEAAGGRFYEWGQLATYSGAMGAVMLIVQFLKLPAGAMGRVPTRLMVYGVSFALLLGAQACSGALTGPKDAALAALNAVAVALGAMGLYERTIGAQGGGKDAMTGGGLPEGGRFFCWREGEKAGRRLMSREGAKTLYNAKARRRGGGCP